MESGKDKWATVPLGSIAEFRNGVNFTKTSFGSGIKIIGVSDFQDYTSPHYESLEEINPEGIVKDADLLRWGDVLFVRSNGNRQLIGRSLFIDRVGYPITHSAFTIRTRFVTDTAFPRFYAYLFRTLLIRQKLAAFGGGTNISNLNQGILSALEVPLPPVWVQRKISAILSAYDDLIENNLRRIKILEEMAQSLYREWFVKFRFPGHQRVRMVDSPLGKIPQGWKTEMLCNLVNAQYGYTESAQDKPVGPKFLRGMDINKHSYIDWDTVPYCPISHVDHVRFQLSKGDVVIIRMADPGKVGIVEENVDGVFASYLVRLRLKARDLTPYYLSYFLLSDRYQGYISGASTGTTRKSASASVITGIDMILPPRPLMDKFDELVASLRQLLSNLLWKNVNLRQTRNLFLPKLISGELDVSELDINVPEEEA